MFHYVRSGFEHKCGVPSEGLPGLTTEAAAFIDTDNVATYVIGTCECRGCCHGIEAPTSGNFGSCSADGTLPFGASCDLLCNPGNELASDSHYGPGPAEAVKRPCVFHRKSVLHGAVVWARRTLNSPTRRFPPRAECTAVGTVFDAQVTTCTACDDGKFSPEVCAQTSVSPWQGH